MKLNKISWTGLWIWCKRWWFVEKIRGKNDKKREVEKSFNENGYEEFPLVRYERGVSG